MKKKLIISLFCCVALIQLIAPLSMIAKRESVLKNGQQFKFVTAPVDPFDAFRGRYVALRIAKDSVSVPAGTELGRGESVYAHIAVDSQGFATLTTVTISAPKGTPYIQAKIKYILGGKAHLDLFIDRYYMEESAALRAERAYREYSRRGKQDAYVLVRIKNGFAVIEGLYLGDKRIEDVAKSLKK
ncbi:MAG: GDYXXLXY domain-containing protein [Candidatus Omnitrophota bacterium]